MSKANPMNFCAERPMDAMAHPTECAQYYDCRQRGTRLGETYLAECPYPQLFDPELAACVDYTLANCGMRREPIAPCKACSVNRCTL